MKYKYGKILYPPKKKGMLPCGTIWESKQMESLQPFMLKLEPSSLCGCCYVATTQSFGINTTALHVHKSWIKLYQPEFKKWNPRALVCERSPETIYDYYLGSIGTNTTLCKKIVRDAISKMMTHKGNVQ